MATVLKITKSDKTVHTVPVTNKAFYLGYNNRLPADQKWKIEEIDEKEAKNLPFVDDRHVTPADAVTKAQELQTVVADKDAEIERLKAQLAAQAQAPPVPPVPPAPPKPPKPPVPPAQAGGGEK